MSILQLRVKDAGGRKPYTNAAPATAAGELVTYEQMLALAEGNAFKDNVRVSTQANISLASPGAAIDGVTMALNDRVLVRAQTAQAENGIYIFNGAAAAMTRALDGSTFEELESALVMIDEGTNAGTRYRQTQVNGVIGTNNVVWSADGTAPPATESASGVAEIATQAETDTGTDDARFVTPLKLKTSPLSRKAFVANVGDGTATSLAVTHNLGSEDVEVQVRETGGSKRIVEAEVQITSTNVVTILTDTAPALNSLRVTVQL